LSCFLQQINLKLKKRGVHASLSEQRDLKRNASAKPSNGIIMIASLLSAHRPRLGLEFPLVAADPGVGTGIVSLIFFGMAQTISFCIEHVVQWVCSTPFDPSDFERRPHSVR